MTTEIVQTNEHDEVTETDILLTEPNPNSELASMNKPMFSSETKETWESIRIEATDFFENAKDYISKFFKDNRQFLNFLGWFFFVFLGLKLLFASLDAIDDIPLVTPLLKLIGLVYLVRFVWRYLIREGDRKKLWQRLDRAKAEIFGAQS